MRVQTALSAVASPSAVASQPTRSPSQGWSATVSQDTPGRRLRGPPAGWPLWYSAKLDKMLKRPPRKIRRWVQETGARYEPGFGWYVERPRVSDPPPGIDRMTWYASVPPVIERIPIEPPLQWPVSSDVRTALILERLAKLADAYDGLPGPVKDPAEEENFVTTALHALAARGSAPVAPTLKPRVVSRINGAGQLTVPMIGRAQVPEAAGQRARRLTDLDHPGNLGGSDSWEDAGSWQHSGSTPRSCASAR